MTAKMNYTDAWRTAVNTVARRHTAAFGSSDIEQLRDYIVEVLCIVAEIDPFDICNAVGTVEPGYLPVVCHAGELHHYEARWTDELDDVPQDDSKHVLYTYTDGTDIEGELGIDGSACVAALDVAPGPLREHGRARTAVALLPLPMTTPMVVMRDGTVYTPRAALCAELGDTVTLQDATIIRSVVAPDIPHEIWRDVMQAGIGINEWLCRAMMDVLDKDAKDAKGGE